MPTCLAPPLRSSLVVPARASQHHHALVRETNNVSLRCRARRERRRASTAAARADPPRRAEDSTHFHHKIHTLTVLHKTASLIPRVLPAQNAVPERSQDFWESILNKTQDELSSISPERSTARLVVYGCDQFSGAQPLVAALLEEPFSSESHRALVRDRWRASAHANALSISYDPQQSISEDSAQFHIRSPWLQQFPIPVELVEIPPASTSEAGHSATQSLFAADVPIVVCNPVTTPLPALFQNTSLPLTHANAILVITSSADDLSVASAEFISKMAPPTLTVSFVNPSRALSALDILNSDPSSILAIQRYQDGFSGSKVPELTNTILQKVSALASENGTHSVDVLHTRTANELVKCSLASCRDTLMEAQNEVNEACKRVSALRDEVMEFRAKIIIEVLGSDGNEEVKNALEKAGRDVKVVMDQLTWWRMVWRVDDIGDVVRAAVEKAWCRDLEDKLIFQAGRLASQQTAFSSASCTLLSAFSPPSPFHSPILQNTLAQLRSAPSYPIQPASLTVPIHTRRDQLSYPTALLHRNAQQLTVGMGGSVLGGFGVAWAGWAGQLGALGSLSPGLETETAFGLGMLGAIAGVRWVVGRWEKAKAGWWRDWDRVGQGLERDLTATLERTVADKVVILPETACTGLGQLASRRKDEIEALKDELVTLEEESKQTEIHRH